MRLSCLSDSLCSLSKCCKNGSSPRICTSAGLKHSDTWAWRGVQGHLQLLLGTTAATLMSERVERPVMLELARLWLSGTVSAVKQQMERRRIIRGRQTPWVLKNMLSSLLAKERPLSLQTAKRGLPAALWEVSHQNLIAFEAPFSVHRSVLDFTGVGSRSGYYKWPIKTFKLQTE